MTQNAKRPEELLPLAPPAYAILMTLVVASKHGYDILNDVESILKQGIASPTLYRHIRQLVDAGLIVVDEARTAASDDARRRYYKLTGLGCRVLSAETERLYEMAKTAKGLLGGLQPTYQTK